MNKKDIIDKVLRFCAHLSNNQNMIFHGITREPNHEPSYHFKLGVGKTDIIYKDIRIKINYQISDEIVGNSVQAVKFHTLELESDRNKDFFSEFLENAHEFCKMKKGKTEIITYIFKNGFWQTLSKLPKRDKTTLYLPEKILDEIINDVDGFLKNREKYLQHGIPYKRNYLFEGLPGTGKTSLIFVLASYFDMDIAIINFGLSVDDATFMKSVSKLPNNCILVLEDIDTLFINRKPGDTNKSMVSFSGILNTLDGIARRDKQITFLTTNYISKLDSALIRPGRIDKIITFEHATMEQIRIFFFSFIPHQKEKWGEFKKKIAELKVTTAILQSFFFKYVECKNILKHVVELKKMARGMKSDTWQNMFV